MKILLVDMSSGIGGAQISLYLIAKSLKNSNNKWYISCIKNEIKWYINGIKWY